VSRDNSELHYYLKKTTFILHVHETSYSIGTLHLKRRRHKLTINILDRTFTHFMIYFVEIQGTMLKLAPADTLHKECMLQMVFFPHIRITFRSFQIVRCGIQQNNN